MNEIVQAMVTRRSCRQYWDRPVPEELLDQVLLAGTYAANGRGRQAGRIVVLTKKEDITALEKLNAQALGNPEAQPFYGAPVVLVVLADKSVHTAVEDGSLVIGNMLLAAHALGLGACWIHRAREEFESPEGKTLLPLRFPALPGHSAPPPRLHLIAPERERKDGYPRWLNGAAVWRPAVKAARAMPGREAVHAEAGPSEQRTWQQYP